MKKSQLRRLSTLSVVFCMLALPGEIAAPSRAMAEAKALARTCYPVFAQCTKDSDCCTGFCRVGRVTAYCDYK
jgi:hypothetical protein